MEVGSIEAIWEIVSKGGPVGILFITNIMLWYKIDSKEKEVKGLIKVLEHNTIQQGTSNTLLQKVSDNIIQLLGKIK